MQVRAISLLFALALGVSACAYIDDHYSRIAFTPAEADRDS